MTIIVFRMAGCHSKDLYMTFPACQDYNPQKNWIKINFQVDPQPEQAISPEDLVWKLLMRPDYHHDYYRSIFWDLFISFVSFGVQFVWLPCIREKIHDTLWILIMWYIWIVYPFYHWLKGHWYACLIIVTTVPTRGSILFSSGVLQSIENAQVDCPFSKLIQSLS